jgi:diguanylate cyclase (GGDEF)-like protein/PAS domain S-box-containing protein
LLDYAHTWFGTGVAGQSAPFMQFSGAAILLGPNRRVIAANAVGATLVSSLSAPDGDLAAALSNALAVEPQASHLAGIELTRGNAVGDAPRTQPKRSSFDLDLLPCAGGVLLLGRDISLERALRGALVDSRQRLRDLVDIASDFTWETDTAGKFTMISPQGALGFGAVELIGRDPVDFLMVAEDIDCFVGARASADVWMRDAAGKTVCQHILAIPLTDAAGVTQGARGLARDITAEKLQAQELATARHRERLLVHFFRVMRQADNPRDALSVALRTAIQALGAAGGQLYRWQGEEPILVLENGAALATEGLLLAAIDRQAVQSEIGKYRVLALSCRRQGQRNGCLILWRELDQRSWEADDLFLLDELSDQMALVIHQFGRHEELWRLSETDSLTGLLNRRGFSRALTSLLSGREDDNRGGALVYIDLDNFKLLNDRQGHAAGDAALIATAELLRHWCRDGDLLARLGGDEFVAWLPGTSAELCLKRATALTASTQQVTFFAPLADPLIGMSIGIAWLPPQVVATTEQLLQCADQAMYDSKRQGKGQTNLAVYQAMPT